jgi:uncharacterized protein YhhL (DUF1145 family)
MMDAVIYPTFGLAAVGFGAMMLVHLAALFGIVNPFERSIGILVPGVFVVFLPTILVMTRLTRDFKQKDIWRAALRGCPRWMNRAFYAIFFYGWAGFFVLPLLYGGGMDDAANKARIMSGILLIFYLIPLAVMYSAMHVKASDSGRQCLNGHRVSPLAKFCEECGAPVAHPNTEHRQ